METLILKLCGKVTLLVTGCAIAGCSQSPYAEYIKEESTILERSSGRLSSEIQRARKAQHNNPFTTLQLEGQSRLMAHIVGPTSIEGELRVDGYEVVNYGVTTLKDRLRSVQEGVSIRATISGKAWPTRLNITYLSKGSEYKVSVLKREPVSETRPYYFGTSGEITLTSERDSQFDVVSRLGGSPPPKHGRLVGVDYIETGVVKYYQLPQGKKSVR